MKFPAKASCQVCMGCEANTKCTRVVQRIEHELAPKSARRLSYVSSSCEAARAPRRKGDESASDSIVDALAIMAATLALFLRQTRRTGTQSDSSEGAARYARCTP